MPYSFDSVSLQQISVKWKDTQKDLFWKNTKIPYEQILNLGNEGIVDMSIFVEKSVVEKEIARLRFPTPNKLTISLDENKILNAKIAMNNFELYDLKQKIESKW